MFELSHQWYNANCILVDLYCCKHLNEEINDRETLFVSCQLSLYSFIPSPQTIYDLVYFWWVAPAAGAQPSWVFSVWL